MQVKHVLPTTKFLVSQKATAVTTSRRDRGLCFSSQARRDTDAPQQKAVNQLSLKQPCSSLPQQWGSLTQVIDTLINRQDQNSRKTKPGDCSAEVVGGFIKHSRCKEGVFSVSCFLDWESLFKEEQIFNEYPKYKRGWSLEPGPPGAL